MTTEQGSDTESAAGMQPKPVLLLVQKPKVEADIDRALDAMCRLALQRAKEIKRCRVL